MVEMAALPVLTEQILMEQILQEMHLFLNSFTKEQKKGELDKPVHYIFRSSFVACYSINVYL